MTTATHYYIPSLCAQPATSLVKATLLAKLLAHNLLARALVLGDHDQVVGSVRVDFNLAELAGRDLVLKEDVQVGVG